IAREVVDEDNIAVVDSRTVTFALGLLVEEACALRDQGLSLDELRQRVEALAGRVRLLAVVDTLKYLKMGGRISGATAVVGGLLGLCYTAVQGEETSLPRNIRQLLHRALTVQ
ncbi:MAG: DegV family protein, partial [Oscillospiraceae bacterium]|nr:DegV family protein [Oscillospiraceae bacterium]